MIRWKVAMIGAAVFVLVHAVETARWRAWFEPAGAHDPWFLNNGTAVGFAALTFALLGMVIGTRSAGRPFADAVVEGANATAGAVLAMIAVLFWVGPGTILPIVIVFGCLVVGVSVAAGTAIGWYGTRVLGVGM